MGKKYDLLTERWIPVVMPDGSRESKGVVDVLLQAHGIREISCAFPLTEYGFYRLMTAFLMDALRPETVDDIEDLLACGRFSETDIRAYIEKCLDEGVSFDLFDEKRPFLQSPENTQWDVRTKHISNLDFAVPTGNNHTHFNHLSETDGMSPAQAAALLVPCSLFATAGVKGYPSSINAAPPYFTVIKGNNLFETLVYQLMPLEEISNFDDPPVFWRSDMLVEPKKNVTQTSWLEGMLFPARRIRLVRNDETELIKEVYISQGMNFSAPENWTDPYVTYRIGKEGRFPWRPNITRAVWRNLCDLIDVKGKNAPTTLQLFQRLHGNEPISFSVSLYGVQTNQASYMQTFSHDLHIPLGIMSEPQRIDTVRDFIKQVEDIAARIRNSLHYKEMLNTVADNTTQNFYVKCEPILWTLCDRYLSSAEVDYDRCREYWMKAVIEAAKETLSDALSSLQLHTDVMMEIYSKQVKLEKYLYTLLKGAESNG